MVGKNCTWEARHELYFITDHRGNHHIYLISILKIIISCIGLANTLSQAEVAVELGDAERWAAEYIQACLGALAVTGLAVRFTVSEFEGHFDVKYLLLIYGLMTLHAVMYHWECLCVLLVCHGMQVSVSVVCILSAYLP